MRLLITIFTLSLIFTLLPAKTFAVGSGGVSNEVAGADALAQGNAFVARKGSPSAITYNPAALVSLKESHFSVGTVIQAPNISYKSSGGVSEDAEDQTFVVPHFYYCTEVLSKRATFGFGLTAPFGLGTDWSKNGFARYVSTESDLEVIRLNPCLAWEISEDVSIGFGLDYFIADTTLKKQVNWGLTNFSLTGDAASLSSPDGPVTLEGDGDGFGFNLGLLFELDDAQTIGVAYRSEAEIELDGKAKLTNISGASMAILGGSAFTTDISTELDFPASLLIGYAYQVEENWIIELDLEWIGWSSFDELAINYKDSNPLLEADNPTAQNWEDVYSVGIGSEYLLDNGLTLRGGYFFYETPVPTETFDPSIPDSDWHGITAGLGYKLESDWEIDFAYAALFSRNRTVNNTVGSLSGTTINGEYDTFASFIALNLSRQF